MVAQTRTSAPNRILEPSTSILLPSAKAPGLIKTQGSNPRRRARTPVSPTGPIKPAKRSRNTPLSVKAVSEGPESNEMASEGTRSARTLRYMRRARSTEPTPDNLASKFASKPSTAQTKRNLHKRKSSEEGHEFDDAEPVQKRARLPREENDAIPSPSSRGLPFTLSPIQENSILPIGQGKTLQPAIYIGSAPNKLGVAGQFEIEPSVQRTIKSTLPIDEQVITFVPVVAQPTLSITPEDPNLPPHVDSLLESASQNDLSGSQTERALQAPMMKDLDFFSQLTNDEGGLQSESQSQGANANPLSSLGPPSQPSPYHTPKAKVGMLGFLNGSPLSPSRVASPSPSNIGFASSGAAGAKIPFFLPADLRSPSPFGSIHGSSTFASLPKVPVRLAKGWARPDFATGLSAFTSGGDDKMIESSQGEESLASVCGTQPSEEESQSQGSLVGSDLPSVGSQAEQIPSISGEEGEITLVRANVVLYVFKPETGWAARGRGVLRLKQSKEDPSEARLVMREGTRLLLNVKLRPDMSLRKMDDESCRAFSAPDHLTADQAMRNFSVRLIDKSNKEIFDKMSECISHPTIR